MKPKASGRRKAAIWIALFVAVGGGIAVLILESHRIHRENSLVGAVLVANADPRKQRPISDVEITAEAGGTVMRARSDAAGSFRLTWRARVWSEEEVTLRLRHPDYQPLEMKQTLADRLWVVRMTPLAVQQVETHRADIPVTGIRVRYSVKATTRINVGSTARILEVINSGNVPCQGRPPCSPDGKWKAAVGSLSLDAGEGREFQNVRVSCIAGPCPFTKVESQEFARGGPAIKVLVRAWSDTVTFLVEAEVIQTMLSDGIREAYPSIFGPEMTFTLPPNGQGPSVEAEVDGLEIVFPLGPELRLSWAACSVEIEPNGAQLYRCKLKPGYRFR